MVRGGVHIRDGKAVVGGSRREEGRQRVPASNVRGHSQRPGVPGRHHAPTRANGFSYMKVGEVSGEEATGFVSRDHPEFGFLNTGNRQFGRGERITDKLAFVNVT